MEESTLHGIKDALEQERASVERHLGEYGIEAGSDGVDLPGEEGGFADSAQTTAGRSEILSLVRTLQSQHVEVLDALERLEQGIYGKCEQCGSEIRIERLEAVPTARLCMSCKQSTA